MLLSLENGCLGAFGPSLVVQGLDNPRVACPGYFSHHQMTSQHAWCQPRASSLLLRCIREEFLAFFVTKNDLMVYQHTRFDYLLVGARVLSQRLCDVKVC